MIHLLTTRQLDAMRNEIEWLRDQLDRRYQQGLDAGYRKSRNERPPGVATSDTSLETLRKTREEMSALRGKEAEPDDPTPDAFMGQGHTPAVAL